MKADRQLIIALAKDRVTPAQIAHKLQVTQDHVYYVIRMARQQGQNIPHFRAGKGEEHVRSMPAVNRSLKLPTSVMALLDARAKTQGKTPSELACSLLEDRLLGDGSDG